MGKIDSYRIIDKPNEDDYLLVDGTSGGGTRRILVKNVDGVSVRDIVDIVYPIGSLLFTDDPDYDPNIAFDMPDCWIKWTAGYTIVSCNENSVYPEFQNAKVNGGENFHTITIDELPAHRHTISGSHATISSNYIPTNSVISSGGYNLLHMNKVTYSTEQSGNNQPMNNMQRYSTRYIWTRQK